MSDTGDSGTTFLIPTYLLTDYLFSTVSMAFTTLLLAQPHAKLFHTCKRSLNSTFKHQDKY